MNSERISPALGVRISGIDLTQASDDLIGDLRKNLIQYHLVAVSGQDLDEKALHEFGARWGELLTHPASEKRENPYVQVLASKGSGKGRVFGAWHSDMSWHPTPPWITMLHARETPGFGGDTGYANQHMAWDFLDQARKDQGRSHRRFLPSSESLSQLAANHSGKQFGPTVPDSIHPVVRTHNESGKLALYVNPEFTTHLIAKEEQESVKMLFALWMHATTQEFCYRHSWLPGDIVIWDNRSVMHTAIIDYEAPRYMTRVVVKGDKPL